LGLYEYEVPGRYFPLQKIVPVSPEQGQGLLDGAVGKSQSMQLFQGQFLDALEEFDRTRGKRYHVFWLDCRTAAPADKAVAAWQEPVRDTGLSCLST